jgi:SAM-dependent methyltransferase
MTGDRDLLRRTFDGAADRYDRARPDYPEALYDELFARTGLAAGDHVLEVGCATGKATRVLAARGLRVTCVELGERLAAAARRSLAEVAGVEVVTAAFEAWPPPGGTGYDAVIAATAWHWIDPGVRYRRAWELLRPGGHLAFWSAAHVFPAGGDPFFRELQEVYDEIGEGLPAGSPWPAPEDLPDDLAEIGRSGLFVAASATRFDWETVYDAAAYVDLLETFSGHIAMAPWQRRRLYGEIHRRLGQRPGGTLRRHWGAVLHVARRPARGPRQAAGRAVRPPDRGSRRDRRTSRSPRSEPGASSR